MNQNPVLAHGPTLAAVLRKCLILFTMLPAVSLPALAQDFEADGFRYSVLSEDERTVAVTGYIDDLTDLSIPGTVNNGGVTYSVTGIGDNAFKGTYLTSVTVPNSVTSIGEYAFKKCTSLTSASIPNSVTSIGQEAFSGCTSLVSVTIPNFLTSIERGTFYGCALLSVTIPNTVTSIGDWAFAECTSLSSVTIPNSVTSIGSYAFSGGMYSSITIPNSVTSIGSHAFSKSSLTSVTIPNSVTRIEKRTFSGCTSLVSVTIPNSVTSIGEYAFYNCIWLKNIYSQASTPPSAVEEDTFSGVPEDAVVYVPEGAVAAYSTAVGWNYFSDFREMTFNGVSDISAGHDARPSDVYNTHGILVRAKASQADIDDLAPGLYIIRDRKVLVK